MKLDDILTGAVRDIIQVWGNEQLFQSVNIRVKLVGDRDRKELNKWMAWAITCSEMLADAGEKPQIEEAQKAVQWLSWLDVQGYGRYVGYVPTEYAFEPGKWHDRESVLRLSMTSERGVKMIDWGLRRDVKGTSHVHTSVVCGESELAIYRDRL